MPIVTQLVDLQARPRKLWTQSLSWVLFVVGIALYSQFSVIRHKENPEDRVVPSTTQLWQGIKASVLEPALSISV
jgi:NitT/TauT family transport system permease protein